MKYFIVISIALLLFTSKLCAQSQVAIPDLQCVTRLADGTVRLVWEDTEMAGSTIVCGSTNVTYEIYRSNTVSAGYTLIETISDVLATEYIDLTSSNNTLFYYMVKKCNGEASQPSLVLDSDPPLPPTIIKVSVSTDTEVAIDFQNPFRESPEAYGYIINRTTSDGITVAAIDTFIPPDPTAEFFTYSDVKGAIPGTRPEGYKISTFDRCFETHDAEQGRTNLEAHKTMFLSITGSDCESELELTWTPYEGWGDDLKEYQVYAIDQTGVAIPELIANVPATKTSLSYTLPLEQSSACISVRAIHKDGVTFSNSNIVCNTLTSINGPDYIYITNVTVLDDNQIDISWNIDTEQDVTKLSVVRGPDSSDLATVLDLPFGTPISANMSAIDTKSEANKFSYYYRIQHADECNRKTNSSYARTIFLRGRDLFNQTNGLDWTPFEITHGKVLQYTIYRGANDFSDLQPVQVIEDPNSVGFIDDISAIGDEAGSYCYFIEATYEIMLPDGTVDRLTSQSNRVCIQQTARIFIPNAFTPNEASNNVFKPKILNEVASSYSMVIVSRWGEVMFESTDPSIGWDGIYKGQKAPQGVYAYVINMSTDAGVNLSKKGTLLLIR